MHQYQYLQHDLYMLMWIVLARDLPGPREFQ